MLQRSIIPLLFLSSVAMGQLKNSIDADKTTHKSRKGIFEITYNKNQWQQSDSASKWDAEFHDTYKLINIYFIEYDIFIPHENIKKTIQAQFEAFGKIKNIKIYDKTINTMKGSYFECRLNYNNYKFVYQGFLYNGPAGTMEIQFGMQEETKNQYQNTVDAFCNGIKQIK